jgi:hypothetical protein
VAFKKVNMSSAAVKKRVALTPTAPNLVPGERLANLWKKALTGPNICYSDPNQWRTKDQIPKVRPSSFPFCPRFHVLKELGAPIPDDFTVRSNVYTEIGKAMHFVVQNGLALSGRLWGFWKCSRPGCAKLFDDEPTTWPGPEAECPSCNAVGKYEYIELAVKDPTIDLRGHVDGILLFKDYQSVLEVKTSSDEKVLKMKGVSAATASEMFCTEAPWYGYWHQASSYATLLRKKYPDVLTNLKYVDYIICSRDNPDNFVTFRLDVPATDEWYTSIVAKVHRANRAQLLNIIPVGYAKKESDINDLPTCRWCKLKEHCMTPQKLVTATDELKDPTATEKIDGTSN